MQVTRDDATAAEWYRRVALQDSYAECDLVRLNMRGSIQPVSEEEAERWKKRLADDGECANNIAWTFATSKDPLRRDPAKAIELAKQAIRKDGKDWRWLDTLAAAHAAAGDFKAAVRTEQDSIERLMEFNAAAPALPYSRKKLALYQAGQIYTEGD